VTGAEWKPMASLLRPGSRHWSGTCRRPGSPADRLNGPPGYHPSAGGSTSARPSAAAAEVKASRVARHNGRATLAVAVTGPPLLAFSGTPQPLMRKVTRMVTYLAWRLQSLRNRFRPADSGATLVEYALLVALIAVVCIVALGMLGTNASAKFSTVGSAIQ